MGDHGNLHLLSTCSVDLEKVYDHVPLSHSVRGAVGVWGALVAFKGYPCPLQNSLSSIMSHYFQ